MDVDAGPASASAEVEATAVEAPGRAASSTDTDQQTATPPALNGKDADADAGTISAPPPHTLERRIGRLQSLSDYRSAGPLAGTPVAEECKKRIAQFQWYAPTGTARTEAAHWLWADLRGADPCTIVIQERKTKSETWFILWVPKECMTKKRDIRLALELALVPLAAPKRTAENAQPCQQASERAVRQRSN